MIGKVIGFIVYLVVFIIIAYSLYGYVNSGWQGSIFGYIMIVGFLALGLIPIGNSILNEWATRPRYSRDEKIALKTAKQQARMRANQSGTMPKNWTPVVSVNQPSKGLSPQRKIKRRSFSLATLFIILGIVILIGLVVLKQLGF